MSPGAVPATRMSLIGQAMEKQSGNRYPQVQTDLFKCAGAEGEEIDHVGESLEIIRPPTAGV